MAERWYDATVALGALLFRALDLRLELEGLEQLPADGPVVLAGNHIGYLDFMTIAAAGRERGRNVRFLTRHDVWHQPVAGRAMTGMRHVPVDRAAPAAAYLRARALLREGEAVGIFPEAGISHSLTVRGLMAGAAALALETGAPLVPVAQWGTQRIWTVKRKPERTRHRPVDLRIGPAIAPLPGEDARALTARLGATLSPMVEELQQRPHHLPQPGEQAWWWPAHLGGDAPDRVTALPRENLPGRAVPPTWGPCV